MKALPLLGAVLALAALPARGDDAIRRRLAELEQSQSRDRERIEDLRRELERARRAEVDREIETYLASNAPAPEPVERPRWIEVSADLIFGAGASTATNDQLQELQFGGHDPKRRGFTIQQVELGFVANVDPHFRAEIYAILFLDPFEGETRVELEEAFLLTRRLPLGLELEAGHFYTEFGRHNPQHPHQWAFVDAPVVATRFFGPDGLRAPGFRLGWLAPTESFLHLHFGMQNAEGETLFSFRGNDELGEEGLTPGGRPFVEQDVDSLGDFVYLARVVTSFDWAGGDWTGLFGASGLFGPNSSGEDGSTVIAGIDAYVKWRPATTDRGWPFAIFQAEVLWRRYEAAEFDDGTQVLPEETLEDWGFYAQALYGFARPWTVGARIDWAAASGGDPAGDFLRDDRLRVTLLTAYSFSEYSRLRFQFNYDQADHLDDEDQFSFWLVMEVALGAHPAHKY